MGIHARSSTVGKENCTGLPGNYYILSVKMVSVQTLNILLCVPRFRIGVTNLDSFISIHDDGYEDTEHNIDEETNEQVQVNPTVPPHITVRIAND